MQNLLRKTLKNETSRNNSIAEDIEYIYIRSNSKIETKAIVGYSEMEDKKGKDVVDEAIFQALDLPTTPTTADVILYNGVRFIVTKYKIIGGLYDVTAVVSTHNRGKI